MAKHHPCARTMYILPDRLLDTLEEVDSCFKFE
jgi:hypothetical protein